MLKKMSIAITLLVFAHPQIAASNQDASHEQEQNGPKLRTVATSAVGREPATRADINALLHKVGAKNNVLGGYEMLTPDRYIRRCLEAGVERELFGEGAQLCSKHEVLEELAIYLYAMHHENPIDPKIDGKIAAFTRVREQIERGERPDCWSNK